MSKLIRKTDIDEKPNIKLFGVWLKILIANFIAPFVFVLLIQIFTQIYNPYIVSQFSLSQRISGGFTQFTIFAIMLIGEIISFLLIYRYLKPLIQYVKNNENYEKARVAVVNIPLVLISVHVILWLIGNIVFYIIYNWEAPKGIPFFWSLSTNIIAGLDGALIAAFFINISLVKLKNTLQIYTIKKKEKDFFINIKKQLVFFTVLLNAIVLIGFMSNFFIELQSFNYESLSFSSSFIYISLAILIISSIIYYMSEFEKRFQTKQLREQLGVITKGEGDLTKRLTIINFDSLGYICHDVNHMLDKLVKTIDTIQNVSSSLDILIKKLSDTETSNNGFINDFSKSLNSISEKVDKENNYLLNSNKEVGTLIQKISGNSGELMKYNKEISSLSKKFDSLLNIVHQLEEKMNNTEENSNILEDNSKKMTTNLEKVNINISNLVKSISEIEENLVQITDIGEQVNILAINASIESSHAGEAGKGFSVIAGEISKLSSQTKELISVTSNLLEDIQSQSKISETSTNELSNSLQIIDKRVRDNKSLINDVNEIITKEISDVNNIKEEVQGLTELSNIIKKSSSQQIKNVGSISNFIGSMKKMSKEISESTESLKEGFEFLKYNNEQLRDISLNSSKESEKLISLVKEFSSK